MFIAWSWSPDGKRLAGWRRRKSNRRNEGIVVYSFEDEVYQSLTDVGRNPVWLNDNRRLLLFDGDERRLLLVDSATKGVRELIPPSPRFFRTLTICADNQSIFTSVHTDEADIWLLSLDPF